MVEYALVVAHNTAAFVAGDLFSWVSRLNIGSLGYTALALVALGIASWAFKPSR